MDRLYAGAIFINIGAIALLFLGAVATGIYQLVLDGFGNGAMSLILSPLIFLLPAILYLKRASAIFEGSVRIIPRVALFPKVIFYMGGVALACSTLIVLWALLMLGASYFNSNFGLATGSLLGVSMLPFILGAALIELAKSNAS